MSQGIWVASGSPPDSKALPTLSLTIRSSSQPAWGLYITHFTDIENSDGVVRALLALITEEKCVAGRNLEQAYSY